LLLVLTSDSTHNDIGCYHLTLDGVASRAETTSGDLNGSREYNPLSQAGLGRKSADEFTASSFLEEFDRYSVAKRYRESNARGGVEDSIFGKSHLVPNLRAVLDFKLDRLLVMENQL